MPSNYMAYGSEPFRVHITANSSAGTSEVQTITPSVAPDAGTFTITFYGFTTTALNYNASGATITAAMEALPSVGSGGVVVTGTLASALTLTFGGNLAQTNLDAVTATSSLTAASVAVTFVIATSTPGVNCATAILPVIAGIRYEIDSLIVDPLTFSGGEFRVGFGGNAMFPSLVNDAMGVSHNLEYPQPGNGGNFVGGLPFSYFVLDGSGDPDIWVRGSFHRVPTTNAALKYA